MAKDPYHYFRIEAQELIDGLGSGLLALEREEDPEMLRKLLRLAHTLKGAARVVKLTEIGELAHGLEDLLSPLRDSGARADRQTVETAIATVDRVRLLLDGLDVPPRPAKTEADSAPAPVDESFQSVRVHVRELDGLMEGVNESLSALDALEAETTSLAATVRNRRPESVRAPAELVRAAGRVQVLVEAVASELRDLRYSASELRLLPAQVLVNELQRSARDAAQSLGKRVRFSFQGTEVRIDAAVLAALRGALRHVVQNAVAHGIESEPQRAAAGKRPEGRIEIRLERRGHRVAFLCEDDGRGLDLELVRRVAVERNLADSTAVGAMNARQLIALLTQGGLSTSASVSQVAGRGIGLDMVRATVASLKGEMDIRSESGKGTVVELLVPMSLSSLPALAVDAGDELVYAPLDSVVKTVRVRNSDISTSSQGARVRVDDDFLPYLRLSDVLKQGTRSDGEDGMQSVIVLDAAGRRAALGVNRIRGVHEVVLRSLPAHVGADAVVAGVALDSGGSPRLVLSAPAAVQAIVEARDLARHPAPRKPPPILVIDDSLTTRMLEQSILESAGYDVDLAVCAEDGLDMARKRDYGLFIVDVEMPGMNGFEYVEQTRQDPVLRNIPAILVTSRAAPEDKKRGRDAGASAYIVKSEFNQQEILGLIKRLMR